MVAELTGMKRCVGYMGWFEHVLPVIAAEGGNRGYGCSEPVGVKISKNGPFFWTFYHVNLIQSV
jgi:hypothetical protein